MPPKKVPEKLKAGPFCLYLIFQLNKCISYIKLLRDAFLAGLTVIKKFEIAKTNQ